MRRGLLEEALQEACLIRYTSGSLRSRLFGSGLFHVCWDREDAHCVMVVASKCLDVERGRILSDSVTSRSGSVGRALTARDSSLRYASCALSAAQNSVPGPGPRRERHARRVDVQCGDNRIARSPSRVPGARGFAPRAVGYGCRAVPGHLRLRGQKRCCRSAHLRSMLTTLSDIATCSFSICIYYLVSTYVLTPMTIPCDIPNQIGAVAAISDFCDNR